MIETILVVTVTAIITYFITNFKNKKHYENIIKAAYVDKGTGRFGIYYNPSVVSAKIEIEELQSTSNRTKCRIIKIYKEYNIKSNSYSNICDRLGAINNITWLNSSCIDWFSDSNQVVRNKKIEEIIE